LCETKQDLKEKQSDSAKVNKESEVSETPWRRWSEHVREQASQMSHVGIACQQINLR